MVFEENIICLGHTRYMKHMKLNFRENVVNGFHLLFLPPPETPSTVCLLLPPLRRSPSLEEGGLRRGESGVGRMSAGARCAYSFHRLRAGNALR